MSESPAQRQARIDRLHQRITTGPMADRIQAAAVALAYRYQADRDDVAQDIATAILERADADPAFTSQTDAYIVTFGQWRARDISGRDHRLAVYAGAVSIEDEGITTADALQHNPWPVAVKSLDLRQALGRIPPILQETAAAILSGQKASEAATTLQVSRSVFYARRRSLIEALSQEMAHAR